MVQAMKNNFVKGRRTIARSVILKKLAEKKRLLTERPRARQTEIRYAASSRKQKHSSAPGMTIGSPASIRGPRALIIWRKLFCSLKHSEVVRAARKHRGRRNKSPRILPPRALPSGPARFWMKKIIA